MSLGVHVSVSVQSLGHSFRYTKIAPSFTSPSLAVQSFLAKRKIRFHSSCFLSLSFPLIYSVVL